MLSYWFWGRGVAGTVTRLWRLGILAVEAFGGVDWLGVIWAKMVGSQKVGEWGWVAVLRCECCLYLLGCLVATLIWLEIRVLTCENGAGKLWAWNEFLLFLALSNALVLRDSIPIVVYLYMALSFCVE